MMIYNVTFKVDEAVHDAWLPWMREKLIPAVMATGLFLDHRICRLQEQEGDPDPTYVVQYTAEGPGQLQRYEQEHAASFARELSDRFGTRCLAFRTWMTVIN
jgi:hypothetical protein